jgi:hypothetical protein
MATPNNQPRQEPAAVNYYPPGNSLPQRLDHLLAAPMFWLSVVFLAAMAGVLHRHGGEGISRTETAIMFWALMLLWPIFIAEAVLRFVLRNQVPYRARLGQLLLYCLMPPTRLGAHSYVDPHLIWLPFSGWRHIDKAFRKEAERGFSIPMIIIALLVLPFLAIEYLPGFLPDTPWIQRLATDPGWQLTLNVGTAVIWMAFAYELTVMLSLAPKKIPYLTQHWINVAVVMLPMLDLLPLLRLLQVSRLMSLEKLTQMGRLYRLRGLLMRVWRSFLALEVLQRLLNSSPEKRLKQMQEILYAREEELLELRQEIEELQRLVDEQEAAEEIPSEPVETR